MLTGQQQGLIDFDHLWCEQVRMDIVRTVTLLWAQAGTNLALT